MSARLKPSRSYKDSGVAWFKRIPAQWEVKRLKFVASEPLAYGANESAESNDPTQPRFIRITDIKDDGSLHDDTFRSLPEAAAEPFLLEHGDILLARSGATVGKTFMYRESWGRACHAGYLIRCRLNRKVARPEFVSYFTASSAYWSWLSSVFIQATIQNVSADKYASLYLPLPYVDEQEKIIAFLDRETGKIDALVKKKERLIELLQEKRTALISHAVTQGLYPNAPKKDSSVSWLGHIPEHWEVATLKRNWEVVDCKHRTVPFVTDGVPVASIGEVQGFDLDLSNANQTTHDEYLNLIDGGRRPKRGDVIYSRNATIGAAAYVNTDAKFCMGQDVCLIRSSEHDQRFLVYQLRSSVVMRQLDALALGVTFKRINVEQIKNLTLCCPPPDEQRNIATYLDRETAKLDALISKVEMAIERLQEYRTALISAAITGQIDVRQVSPTPELAPPNTPPE